MKKKKSAFEEAQSFFQGLGQKVGQKVGGVVRSVPNFSQPQQQVRKVVNTIGQSRPNIPQRQPINYAALGNKIGNIALNPFGPRIKGRTVRTDINTAMDFTVRPIIRVGFEGAQSLSKDKRTFIPSTPSQRALLGTKPLLNYSSPNRPAQQFSKQIGMPGLAPYLIAAGIGTDITSLTPWGTGKKAVLSPATKFGKGLVALKQVKKNEEFAKGLKLEQAINKNLGSKLNLPEFKQVGRKLYRAARDEKGFARLDLGLTGGKTEELTPKVSRDVSSKTSIQSPQLKQSTQLPQGQAPGGRIPSSGSISQPVRNPKDPFYNVNRLNIPDEAKETIKTQITGDIKPNIEKVVGSPLTNEEVIKRAQVVSDDLVKIIGKQNTEVLAAAQLRLRQKIAQMAQSGEITEDLLNSLKADKSVSANLGRLLQKRSINVDPTAPESKLKIEMLQKILEVDDDLDKILKLSKNVNWNDPRQTTAFYRQFIAPNIGDWVDKLRYNSMLSSPQTQIVNIASNWEGTGVLTPIQKTLEGGIDATISAFTDKARTRYAGEGIRYAAGYYSNTRKAFKNLLDVFSGKLQIENPDLKKIPLTTTGVSKGIENILDIPGKALEGFDQFFMTLTRGGLERSYKYRLAKGTQVGNLAQKSQEEAQKLLFRGELTPKGEGIISGAFGGGGQWINNARNSANPVFRWLAKLTFPFVNIGTNLAKAGVEANPILGTLNLVGDQDKTAAVAKLMMGGAITLVGTGFALSDRMRAWEPSSAKERDALRRANVPPWSIKIGDNWMQFNKVHPLIGFQLGMVAALTQAWKEKKITDDKAEAIMNGMAGSLRFIGDQTYFRNLSDFISLVNGDVEAYPRLLSNYPSQFVPFRALQGWITRIIDEYQRAPAPDATIIEQVIQNIQKGIPGLSTGVPARTDEFGQPVKYQNRLVNLVSPGRIGTENIKAMGEFGQLQDISKFRQRSTFNKEQLKTDAQAIRDSFKDLSPDEKVTKWQSLVKSNPTMAKKVKEIVQDEKLGLTPIDKSIKSLGVEDGSRAKFLYQEFKKLDTKEEKVEYWNELVKKKIITKEISKQLIYLIKQQ